jgi:hypothetical protein
VPKVHRISIEIKPFAWVVSTGPRLAGNFKEPLSRKYERLNEILVAGGVQIFTSFATIKSLNEHQSTH